VVDVGAAKALVGRRIAVRGQAVGGRGVHVFELREREVASAPALPVFMERPSEGVPEGLDVLVVGTVRRADGLLLQQNTPDVPPAVAADLQGRPVLVAQAIRGVNGVDYVEDTELADALQTDAEDIAADPASFYGQVVGVTTKVERQLAGDTWALRPANGLPLYATVPHPSSLPARGAQVTLIGVVQPVATAATAPRTRFGSFSDTSTVDLERSPLVAAEAAITPERGDIMLRTEAPAAEGEPPDLLVLAPDATVEGEGVLLEDAWVQGVTGKRALRVRTADGRRLTVLLPRDLSTRGLTPGSVLTIEGVSTTARPDRAAMGLRASEVRGLGESYVFATRLIR
jgi:hypothetical protein